MRRRRPVLVPDGDDATRRVPASLQVRILEELIYERIRVAFNLCELLDFQTDLATSIDRALDDCGGSFDERADLVVSLLERAWERLSDEVLAGLAASECRLGAGIDEVRRRGGRRAGGDAPPAAAPTASAGTSGRAA